MFTFCHLLKTFWSVATDLTSIIIRYLQKNCEPFHIVRLFATHKIGVNGVLAHFTWHFKAKMWL